MSKMKTLTYFLQIMEELRKKASFSKSLLAHTAKFSLEKAGTVQKLSYSYQIPSSLCIQSKSMNDKNKKNPLAVSAAKALFDELNASSFIIEDHSHRPGVSVFLSTRLLKPIYSGDEVIIDFDTDKIGKVLGFCSLTMKNKKDNSIVALCKHVKYLPGSYIADTFIAPLIIPVISFLDWLSNSNIAGGYFKSWNPVNLVTQLYLSQRTSNASKNIISIDDKEVEGVFKSLGVFPINKNSKSDSSISSSSLIVSSSPSTSSSSSSSYGFKVTRNLTNLPGMLHGGAIAMTIEEAVRMHLNRDIMLHSLELRYLSAIKGGEAIIRIIDDNATTNATTADLLRSSSPSLLSLTEKDDHNSDSKNNVLLQQNRVSGDIVSTKDGKPAVQFECTIVRISDFTK